MSGIKRLFSNASGSASESLINLFKSKENVSELLTERSIIKGMRIGISYLTANNKPSFLNDIFGSEFTHAAIYLKLEKNTGEESGVLVQYGKYQYIEKDKYGEILKNIGFLYKEKGGVVYGIMENETFEKIFCSAGEIPLILTKKHPKITLKKFLEEIKNKNGPWDCSHYDIQDKNCQHFVVASLKILKPDYCSSQLKLNESMKTIPIVIEEELKKHEI
jgi:hypothetical protein